MPSGGTDEAGGARSPTSSSRCMRPFCEEKKWAAEASLVMKESHSNQHHLLCLFFTINSFLTLFLLYSVFGSGMLLYNIIEYIRLYKLLHQLRKDIISSSTTTKTNIMVRMQKGGENVFRFLQSTSGAQRACCRDLADILSTRIRTTLVRVFFK